MPTEEEARGDDTHLDGAHRVSIRGGEDIHVSRCKRVAVADCAELVVANCREILVTECNGRAFRCRLEVNGCVLTPLSLKT